MAQEYFVNTIQSKLIKNILYNTPLPLYRTAREGDYVVSGFIYVTDSNVIKCTASGLLGSTAQFTILRDYTFGEYYPKYSEKFCSLSEYYDSRTHAWLGKYLRAVRDCQGIDLMPFYNCWPNTYIEGLICDKNGVRSTNTSTADYKCVITPIRLDQTYTLALDSSSIVYISPVFLKNNTLVSTWNGSEEIDLTEKLCEVNNYGNVSQKLSTSFKKPFSVTINSASAESGLQELFYRNEKFLYLFVQVLSSVSTTFVVLEGDYTTQYCQKVYNSQTPDRMWNPLVRSLNFLNSSNWSANPASATLTTENDVGTYTFGTPSGTVYANRIQSATTWSNPIVAAHKVYVSFQYYSDYTNTCFCKLRPTTGTADASAIKSFSTTANSWTLCETILTTTSTAGNLWIYPDSTPHTWATGDTFNVSDVIVIDLTEMFGAGQEPTVASSVLKSLPALPEVNEATIDSSLLSSLDLLQFSNKKQRPFSNRLQEYLSLNVITSRDDLRKDIEFAQKGRELTTGIWSLDLRRKLYDQYMTNNSVRKLDITGYVDKDVENAIRKGYI